MENLYLLLWIFFFAILLMQRQQLKLIFIDIRIIDELASGVVDRKLSCYQLSIFNVKINWRRFLLCRILTLTFLVFDHLLS